MTPELPIQSLTYARSILLKYHLNFVILYFEISEKGLRH